MKDDRQLFCFTYAGGRASFFDEIEGVLPDLHVEKLEYAGHGERWREPYYADFEALAGDMISHIRTSWNGQPYGLFGYSMGSVVVLEVLRHLAASSFPPPRRAFLAAHEPHVRSELRGFAPDELDEWVKRRTISFGAVPEKLVNNRSFWRVYLPLYRADYAIISRYRFEDICFETNVPASVFYSEADTPAASMTQWRRFFIGAFEMYPFEGTHFFIRDHFREIASIIQDGMVSDA